MGLLLCAGLHHTEAIGETLTNLPPTVPPLDFFASKQPLPDLLLKDKRVGRYITGFPAIGWDPESEFNYGGAVQWFDNGPAESPFFRYTPYRQRIGVAATGSTGGTRRFALAYDQPYIADSPWRLRAALSYEQNAFQNYLGIGESTLGSLTFPGFAGEFDDFDEYQGALDRNVNGVTWARYNDYEKEWGGGFVGVERDYLGGRLRPQIGLEISRVKVHDYTGESVDGAIMQPTRLFSENQAGEVVGFEGGWINALKVGLAFDTRDFEPDPSSGFLLEAVAHLSSEVLGSDFDYQQITLSGRVFQNLLGEDKRLILAARAAYVMQFGDVPFFDASRIPFTEIDANGLGGHATLRGYVTDRFVGEAMAYANMELRWSFADTALWGQHLRFMIVPFIDTGSVFDSVGDTSFEDWKVDGGVGFRLAWNLSTVISFDLARSSEGSMFFMELGHQF